MYSYLFIYFFISIYLSVDYFRFSLSTFCHTLPLFRLRSSCSCCSHIRRVYVMHFSSSVLLWCTRQTFPCFRSQSIVCLRVCFVTKLSSWMYLLSINAYGVLSGYEKQRKQRSVVNRRELKGISQHSLPASGKGSMSVMSALGDIQVCPWSVETCSHSVRILCKSLKPKDWFLVKELEDIATFDLRALYLSIMTASVPFLLS